MDPTQRLGSKDVKLAPIREHPFFESVDWETLWSITPPVMEVGDVKAKGKAPAADDAFRLDDLASALEDVEKESK